jgi:hypothetical protein
MLVVEMLPVQILLDLTRVNVKQALLETGLSAQVGSNVQIKSINFYNWLFLPLKLFNG